MGSPIFIIGTERSGTNLLRLMLNAHSAIAVPHPPHIVKLFGPLEARYGELRREANFRQLVNDVCRMVELHTYPWEFRPDRDRVLRLARDRNLLAVYFQLYDQYLAHSGKRRWACKSTFMIEHVAGILHYHPDARFIFMVRDPRDVAVSAKQSIFNHFHVFYTARRWQREQRIGLEWLAKLPPDRIMLLRYEELLADPEGQLRRLCVFLDEPFEEEMLEYHRSREARKSGSLSISWQNTSRPVLQDNSEKFRIQLSQQEIRLIEAIAANEMHALGYNPDFPPDGQQAGLTDERFSYRLSESLLKLRAEVNHLFRDRNSAARIRKNLYLCCIAAVRRIAPPHA
ncbi:MAG: sulfotransferase [Geobacteraceae bacterium]|nr:sulfotransferase [Geobacteraceae bacterium]